MSFVIDASVAAKWFFMEELRDEARAILNADHALYAPTLILAEIGNIVWKRFVRSEITQHQGSRVLATIPLMFAQLVDEAALIESAYHLAVDIGHPIYDCFYLALAQQRGVSLVTADRRLLAATSGHRSLRAIDLANVAEHL